MAGRRTRRRKQLPDERKETTGYCKLKEEALDRRELAVEMAGRRARRPKQLTDERKETTGYRKQ